MIVSEKIYDDDPEEEPIIQEEETDLEVNPPKEKERPDKPTG